MPEPDVRRVVLSVSVAPELADDIREEAERENRSVSNWLATLAQREVDRRRRERGE